MKKLLLLWAVLAVAIPMTAQHLSYDDFLCDSLVQLGVAPACPTDTFTNVGATNSNIGFDNAPSCFNGGIATRDVWFSFVCADTLLDYRITLTGVGANRITNPQFAIYRGDCAFDGFAELLCAVADVGENSLFLDLQGLTPGLTYFIRVSDYSITATPNWGDFTLCVDKIPPIVTIDQGSSTLCSGTLYDSGGPDNDYGPDEDHTFVICPSQPSACITFTLDYYNIEAGASDVLNFYDGSTVTGQPIGEVGDLNGDGNNNWGGVCYAVQAASGCLTVQFQSDNSVEFEGWQGHWQCSTDPCPPTNDITLNPDINQDSIAEFVKTPFTTVNITGVKCPEGGYATFSYPTDNNALQMGKGLVLTSGLAAAAVGPSSDFAGNLLGQEGDADLDTLSQQSQGANFSASEDACVVEADVFAATDELSFEYVFGSEEYPDFVNTNFNDIFAFLISGPGITGDPGLNGAKNLATLPGTTIPVEINSVNFEQNWAYYRDNSLSQELVYDGLTSDSLGVKKSLTARSKVTPCNTYHLKFAVADRGDDNYDSAVFISKIQGGGPSLTVNFASGINYFIESCTGGQDVLVVKLSEPKPVATTYAIAISGTATLGVDYLLNIPPAITFQPGQTELSFPITPIGDNITEGSETIIIEISSNFGCGTVTFSTLVVNLNDNVEVQVSGGDTLLVCEGGTLQLHAIGAQSYFWTPPGAVSNPFIGNPTITPTQDIWLELTGTVGTCVDKDSAFIKIIAPVIEASAVGSPNICSGGSVQLQSTNNVNNAGLLWTPAKGLSDKFNPNPVASPLETTTYQVKVTIAGCTVTDEVTVTVDTLFFPTLVADTTVCQNYPVQLADVLNTTNVYAWTPTDGLSDPSSSGPIALPAQTTTYTLTATSATGACSQTGSVTVTVIPANVDIVGDDYREICLGDTVTLDAQVQPPGSTITWSPSFYVSSTTGPSVTSSPDESVTITASTTVNGCAVRDSVFIRVDSLPTSAIFLDPEKAVYCPGDTIFLLSKTYEPADFPALKPEWISGGGDVTPLDLWNLVIFATTTKVFTRKIENRGCSTKDSITVNVGVIPTIMITAEPPNVCPGQPAQLTATVEPSQTLKWQENPTLSCTECPNPVATPLGTTNYQVTTPDADCPGGQSITVQVLPTPTLILPTSPSICPGGSILLNSGPSEPGTTYTWTSVPAGFTSSLANPTVTPTTTTTYKVVAQGPQCSSTLEVEVTVANATLEAGPNQSICLGQSVTLAAATTGTFGTLSWQPGGQTGASIQVTPLQTTTYSVQLLYGPNCVLSDSLQVTVAPAVTVSNINATPLPSDTLCLGTPITLKVTKTPPTATLTWLQNGEPIPNATGDSIQVTPNSEAVVFTVTATLGNCTDVSPELAYQFMRCFDMPNAFTPNGDNINGTFGPLFFGGNAEVVSFAVYNRWGQKVFESSGDRVNWDGRVDSKEAPSDVYAYVIQVRYAGGETETREGEVMLLR